MHNSFGDVKRPDPEVVKAQKTRLSKSNFLMGQSPQTYTSTNLSEHVAKTSDYLNKEIRLSNAIKNQQTNFIHGTGFEKRIANGQFGPNTHKGVLDQDNANDMMNHLKASHFILGKDQSGFGFRSSTHVGKFAQTARIQDCPPWATMKTHFGVGTDQENKTTDYAMRFQELGNPNNVNGQMHIDNKTKIEKDSTILGIPKAEIQEGTTMNDNTKPYPVDESKSSKGIQGRWSTKNASPLPNFIAKNIRTTHYEIGPGGKARPTETLDSFSPRDSKGAKFELSSDRINFFKDSHFVIGSEGEAREKIVDKTSQDSALPPYKGLPKPDAKECSAYKVRFGKVQVGSTDPRYPSPFVTSGQVQQKWIQPQYNWNHNDDDNNIVWIG